MEGQQNEYKRVVSGLAFIASILKYNNVVCVAVIFLSLNTTIQPGARHGCPIIKGEIWIY